MQQQTSLNNGQPSVKDTGQDPIGIITKDVISFLLLQKEMPHSNYKLSLYNLTVSEAYNTWYAGSTVLKDPPKNKQARTEQGRSLGPPGDIAYRHLTVSMSWSTS